jgi:thiamine pyrophosphate-dependent acetolactate synthase large subunit-like protein
VAWLAAELAGADLPVLLTDYAGDTDEGFKALAELAELLHAPVIDCGQRLSFPTGHELNFTGLEGILGEADLAVCLDVEDPVGRLSRHRPERVVLVSPAHLRLRSWAHDFGPLLRGAVTITGSAEATLPALVAAVREQSVEEAARVERRRRLSGRRERALAGWRAEAECAEGADALPAARLAAELRRLLEGERWTLVHGSLEGWERRVWPFEQRGQHLGWHGGGGLGYGFGASLGAALALGSETLCVNLQPDGDLLYLPSALWTAARYRIPLLTVMHNNRQYRNSVEHAEEIALARGRDRARRYEATSLDDPAIDFAALARSFGVTGVGPVTTPDELEQAWQLAREVVGRGEPVLIDVVTTGA